MPIIATNKELGVFKCPKCGTKEVNSIFFITKTVDYEGNIVSEEQDDTVGYDCMKCNYTSF